MEFQKCNIKPFKRGIRGWELSNPDPELFDTRIVEVFGHCNNCEFLGTCGTPSESIRELVPKRGELVELGTEHSEEGEKSIYYALISKKEKKFILMREPKYLWAKAFFIDEEEVPMSIRSALPRRKATQSWNPRPVSVR